jgi:ABC-2 type transport system permease protein
VIALIRTEFTKAARRTRSLAIGLILVGLPTLIVVAIKAHGNQPDRNENGTGLFRLARQSGLLVPAAVLAAMSGFLLVVIAGTFAGDSVAGDAAWGNLRYLLMRPVGRGRLLVAKAFVAGALIWVATIVVALAGLVAGIILFGAHPITVPAIRVVGGNVVPLGGFHLGNGVLLARTALATAYVAFGFTALLALGTLFSTLTDTAASAIGATIGVYIVSEILDAISQLGRVRYGFPTHYLDSWQSMLIDNRFSHDMIAGVVVQVAYLVVCGGAALVWFRRKDIRS